MIESRNMTFTDVQDIDEEIHEACGVFGIINQDDFDTARLVYFGLYALQHRGQESCGIAINDDGNITGQKGIGLVPEVFTDKILDRLEGKAAIGHTRYSTTGGNSIENCQPLIINYKDGRIALAHNGNLVNASKIRCDLENQGAIFQTSTDSEVIANLISRYGLGCNDLVEILKKTMDVIEGSYALVILTQKRLIGIRDPWGLRPLCIGKLGNSYILASENCAFDTVGAEFIRDVEPGEIIIIEEGSIKSVRTNYKRPHKFCIFEHIYFARPDSIIDGASIYQSRLEAGKLLAIEHPAEADLVVGVPDSGITAAIGFSRQSGIPYGEALIKNRYVGRTFIQPTQKLREQSVNIKLNALRKEIEGKRIVLIDDSIVRGTTTKIIVQMLKDASAKEIHMRISSPPVLNPCYFGIDIASKENLIAANYSIEEIKELIAADSLGFLSVASLLKTPVGAPPHSFCTGCFTGEYPMEIPQEMNKFSLEKC
ncbi:MAG TPA: amidophosphoribosyltransferase [Ruminiclostridium sp.]|jgi:amidophosphoribosyltransferase|nr:amidophosphoribosyltransferase [Ruminiclostridium sp.]